MLNFARIYTDILALLTGTAIGGSTPSFDMENPRKAITLTDGNGNYQARQVYASSGRTLASGANETLDFNGGGLLDPLGNAIAFTNIKAVEIVAADTNTTSLTIGAASTPFLGPMGGTAPTMTLAPGDRMLWVCPKAGWTVTAGSNDSIKVVNGSGASASYDIKVIGF
jgi:hypothetical protein